MDKIKKTLKHEIAKTAEKLTALKALLNAINNNGTLFSEPITMIGGRSRKRRDGRKSKRCREKLSVIMKQRWKQAKAAGKNHV